MSVQPFGISPKIPSRYEIPGFDALSELALDLRWSWNHRTDKVWLQLDPELWELTRNPWIVLQTVSQEKLKKMLNDPEFKKLVDDLIETKRHDYIASNWFQKNYPASPLSCVAYFSMEFMLSEALPIYSGGLGNVAGDQLKSASDLGVPVIGIGLLYQQGYFRQVIDKDGTQQALYPYNDPGQLPIRPLRKPDGEWLRLEIALPGWSLWLRAWQVQVGRTYLYLLDSNDAMNFPAHRGITSELYGGASELRLKQELLLGIGGWRLLEAIGIKPEVCHLNEGHAAFAILERAKSFMNEAKVPFDVALATTRAGNLFTTHTAVPAGFDLFHPSLIDQYLGSYAKSQLGISLHELLALGRKNPSDPTEHFNMAYLSIRGSGAVNGVSRLHGKVSRRIFEDLFPHWPENDVPVGYVTNGVHAPSWDSPAADKLWTDSCGKFRWLEETETLEKCIQCIPDAALWHMRNTARKSLIDFTRKCLAMQFAARGASEEDMERARHLFDPHTLTLGFARRFATYKRPNLLLQDRKRLLQILTNPQRPVQLIIAGKAHPADKPGQAMIKEWMQFIKTPEARPHVIFLSDYDMFLTEYLVQGVDVWINTPRRPWEACGTSGMKVLVNGGLNLSELDGWWAEAYTPEVGWALGDGQEHGDDPLWDKTDAEQLYDLLEKDIVPAFYTYDKEGIPTEWVKRMRQSMAKLTPYFSANRAVRQYTIEQYLPAAVKITERATNLGKKGKDIVEWRKNIREKWSALRFTHQKTETQNGKHTFEVQVYLDELNPDFLQVQIYADSSNSKELVHQNMDRVRQIGGDSGTYLYRASVEADRPADYFTPRIIPFYPSVSVPLEEKHILWQH